MDKNEFGIFSGQKSMNLAEQICSSLGCDLGKFKYERFADGEFSGSFEESIRGKDTYIVQSTFAPADNLMELLLMVDAAKRASAHYIAAVIPYFGWARQDRFFNVPVDHLYASNIFLDYIRKNIDLKNLVIATPDVGGTKRANTYAHALGVPMVICHKLRLKANVVAEMRIIGDVEDKDVLLVDDIVDTAGTITKAANLMMDHGARSVRAMCSHAVMSDPATERVEQSALKELVVTDSIPYTKKCDKVKVLSIAPLFAEAIRRVETHESISNLYGM